MDQLIQELEELLAERKKVKALISSTQIYSVSSGGVSLALQSSNPQLSNALDKLKQHFGGGVMAYKSFVDQKIIDKLKEMV